jgi:hypothetical protein
MLKFVCLLLMLLMTSGCCQLFGLCTSVNVHTSASSPDKFANSDLYDDFGPLASRGLQATADPGAGPTSAAIASPHNLFPD